MNIASLPFNRLIGMELGATDSEFLISLPTGGQYTNHLGTVHASALFAVAEAASGVFLIQQFGSTSTEFLPVVRRVEVKFRRPAQGRVQGRASMKGDEVELWRSELDRRGRVSAAVSIEVVDDTGAVIVSAVVEWFIARNSKNSQSG